MNRKSSVVRHFLLLEVMIAFALVALCVIPMLRPHLYMLTQEQDFLREVELDRVVGVLYCELLVEGFYRSTIPWRSIEEEETVVIDDDRVRALGYKGFYTFAIEKEKGKISEGVYSLFLISITYTLTPSGGGAPLVYTYELFVQRAEQVTEKGGTTNG